MTDALTHEERERDDLLARVSGARLRVAEAITDATLPRTFARPLILSVGNGKLEPLLALLDASRVDVSWHQDLRGFTLAQGDTAYDVVLVQAATLQNSSATWTALTTAARQCRQVIILGDAEPIPTELRLLPQVLELSEDIPSSQCAAIILRIAELVTRTSAEIPSETSPTRATAGVMTETHDSLLRHLTNELANVAMSTQASLLALEEISQKESLVLEPSTILTKASQRLCGYVRDISFLLGETAAHGALPALRVLDRFVDSHIEYPAQNQQFISRLAQDLWSIQLSDDALTLLCKNLIDNARQATLRGGEIRLEADNVVVREPPSTLPELLCGAYVRLRVSDNGIGMSERALRRAGAPFFSTWGDNTHWKGLGLAQAKAICRRAGGHLSLRSREGRGTIATAWLPRCTLRETLTYATLPTPEHLPISRFLLVDDEPLILSSLSRNLCQLGHSVYLAQDSATALAIVNEEPACHYAVIDLHLGRGSGFELARELARTSPSLRLIMSSGFTDIPVTSLDGPARSINCAFLRKPFTCGDLLTALQRIPRPPAEE